PARARRRGCRRGRRPGRGGAADEGDGGRRAGRAHAHAHRRGGDLSLLVMGPLGLIGPIGPIGTQEDDLMDRAMCFLGGAAIGAATMYYFDPDRGRARRAMCESGWVGRANKTKDYLGKAGRDLSHRVQGLAAEATNIATGNVRERTPDEGGHQAPSIDLLQENLAPGTRLVLGTAGAGLFALGLTKEAPQACLMG